MSKGKGIGELETSSGLFETRNSHGEVIKGIFGLKDKFGEYKFRMVKLVGDSSENCVFKLYCGSTDGSGEVCLAYSDLNETMLVRLGDEVVISQVDQVGHIRKIEYYPDINEISCVIDLGEEYERFVEIKPSQISINCTLLGESGIGD